MCWAVWTEFSSIVSMHFPIDIIQLYSAFSPSFFFIYRFTESVRRIFIFPVNSVKKARHHEIAISFAHLGVFQIINLSQPRMILVKGRNICSAFWKRFALCACDCDILCSLSTFEGPYSLFKITPRYSQDKDTTGWRKSTWREAGLGRQDFSPGLSCVIWTRQMPLRVQ